MIAQFGDGGKALGQNLAVAAMGAKDKVVWCQVVGLTHSRRFLANRKVSRTFVLVRNALIDPLALDLIEHRLEGADKEHIAVDAHQIGRTIFWCVGCGIGHIGIKRNGGRSEYARTTHLCRVDQNRFGHTDDYLFMLV